MPPARPVVHGFLNVDKPAGMTSHDVVARLRRLAGQKRVGHGGTLDPAATGVLPLALGEATKLVSYLVDGRKRYTASIQLGVTTTTDDAEGEVLATQPVPPLSQTALEAALAPFVGTILQVPPMYSAIQVGGQRLYDLARRGETVELEPRPVEIDAIAVLAWEPPLLRVDVRCGKGTYIRAIARDLGAALGCGAHLAGLRRTAVGPLDVASAVPLAALEADPALVRAALLPPEMAIADWLRLDLDDAAERRIRNGLPLPQSDRPLPADTVARAHGAAGPLVALVRSTGDSWQPFRVFSWS